ncbi:MAG: NADH-quinone oxidoreductase subunit K [Clostridia bacterium]|nr:NADH-quinone oxidoreductase subunit K [Clostridia bacterium]
MTFNYFVSFFFIVLGLFCIITRHNLFKVVIGMSVVDYGTNLLIVSIGASNKGTAPIYAAGEIVPGTWFVDPIPQALTLTSIVIGACITAMALSLVIKIYSKYGTLDTREIRRLHG